MFLLFTYTAELAGCHDRQLCLFGFHFSAWNTVLSWFSCLWNSLTSLTRILSAHLQNESFPWDWWVPRSRAGGRGSARTAALLGQVINHSFWVKPFLSSKLYLGIALIWLLSSVWLGCKPSRLLYLGNPCMGSVLSSQPHDAAHGHGGVYVPS